jgi:hypothetical protein
MESYELPVTPTLQSNRDLADLGLCNGARVICPYGNYGHRNPWIKK